MLPHERNKQLSDNVKHFCKQILNENTADTELLHTLTSSHNLSQLEARVLLACVMFLVCETLNCNGKPVSVRDLLSQLIKLAKKDKLLSGNDPFLIEANCALEAMNEE